MLIFSDKNGLDPLAAEALKLCGATVQDDGIPIYTQQDASKNEFCVKCNGRSVQIRYCGRAQLFRALSYVASKGNETFSITQSPRFTSCGVMVDCSRNAVPTASTLKRLLMRMALMGHDTLYLYIEDIYELDGEPYFGYMRGRYSKKEIIAVREYAGRLGITLVPCIQTLAHLRTVLHWDVYRDVRDMDDVLLIGNERTYELIEKMVSTCNELFGKRIHIGMDEAQLAGLGNYLKINGYTDPRIIILQHLKRVIAICDKYGVTPMMWSDMFLGSSGIQASVGEFESVSSEGIPKNIELVYWDYYNTEKTQCKQHLDNHASLGNKIVFAGGAWKWSGFTPHNRHSFKASLAALEECGSHGVTDVFVTAWGDDGAEASLFSVLPVFQLYAEVNYNRKFTKQVLIDRFFECTGESFDDYMLLDLPDEVFMSPVRGQNPSKYMLYQDIFMGLFDAVVPENAAQFFSDAADKLNGALQRAGEYKYVFATSEALCRVLAIKACIGNEIRSAYLAGNKEKLFCLRNKALPDLLNEVKRFHTLVREQWFIENKPFGYEVIDSRIATVEARIVYAAGRISEYLRGETQNLDELEQERLPFLSAFKEKPERVGCSLWKRIFSAAETD